MDWIKTLGAIAPALATAMGGPLAGAATKYIASNLLDDESASLEDVKAAIIGANPEQLTKLKSINLDFEKHMAKIGVDMFEIEANDKKDARKQHKHSLMPNILVIMLTIFVMIIVGVLFFCEAPSSSREVLFMLLGVVVKEWSGALQYWHGSTRSSADKSFYMK